MSANGAFRAASDSRAHKDIKKEAKLLLNEAIAAAKKRFTKERPGALRHFVVVREKDALALLQAVGEWSHKWTWISQLRDSRRQR